MVTTRCLQRYHFCPRSPVYHRIKTLPIVTKILCDEKHTDFNLIIQCWCTKPSSPPSIFVFSQNIQISDYSFLCFAPASWSHSFVCVCVFLFFFLFVFCFCSFFFFFSYFSVPSFCMPNFGLSIPTLIRL